MALWIGKADPFLDVAYIQVADSLDGLGPDIVVDPPLTKYPDGTKLGFAIADWAAKHSEMLQPFMLVTVNTSKGTWEAPLSQWLHQWEAAHPEYVVPVWPADLPEPEISEADEPPDTLEEFFEQTFHQDSNDSWNPPL